MLRSRGVHVAREWAVSQLTVFICHHLTTCVAAEDYDDDTTTRERISAWLDQGVCCPGRYSASRVQATFLSSRTVWFLYYSARFFILNRSQTALDHVCRVSVDCKGDVEIE